MRKKLLCVFLGIVIGATLVNGTVFAKNMQQMLSAYYKDIKIVVDGVLVEPKDSNGNPIEPFIYNGSTYLPVRGIGEAFGKEVEWDGDTSTVYVGGIQKPAKEVYLYDKPYLECDIPAEFEAGEFVNLRAGDIERNNITNYIGFNLDAYEFIDLSNREYRNSVTYALNGSAEKVKGTFVAPAFNYVDSAEYSVSFYNENGKLLYQSPIMTESVAPVDFEFDARNALKLKVEFNGHSGGSGVLYNFYCIIKDFALITTDY